MQRVNGLQARGLGRGIAAEQTADHHAKRNGSAANTPVHHDRGTRKQIVRPFVKNALTGT